MTRADARSWPGQSRRRILDAARVRFLDEGYGATLASIAADAGVSVETVYKAFKNKAGVLKAVFDVAIAGDDEPVPIMERSWVAAIQAEPDAAEKLRMYTDRLPATMARVAPILLLPARRGARPRHRRGGAAAAGRARHRHGRVRRRPRRHRSARRRRSPVEVARDLLWTLNAVEIYELLVDGGLGDADRYRQFVADALIAALVIR